MIRFLEIPYRCGQGLLELVFIDPHDDKAHGATGSGRRSHAVTSRFNRIGGPNPCEFTTASTGSARPAYGFAGHD